MSLTPVLDALRQGFYVFPVAAGKKTPHRLAGNWGQTATNDPVAVARFWTQVDPQANFGVACKPSNLLVVDLDQAKEDWNLRGTEWEYVHGAYGARVNGIDLIDELSWSLGDGDRSWMDTFTVRTGSGGLHLYYRWDPSWPRITQASPVKGVIDVRGNGGQWGGYVLGAGSVTDSGAYTVEDGSPVALPPVWIRLLVMEKPPAPKKARMGVRQPGSISYSGLVETVRNAQEGNRNNALAWTARTMCEEGATEEEALSTLGPAAREAGLGDMEIERTIQSSYRTQRYKEGR